MSCGSANAMTSPPFPPLPPLGPPRGTNFSRRKADATAPAVAGDDADFYFIDELHLDTSPCSSLPFSSQKKSPERGFLDSNVRHATRQASR